MQNENAYGQMPALDAGGEVGYLLGLLWVLALMGALVAAFIGKRTNERKDATYGYELEVIKSAHHHSTGASKALAHWLTTQGAETTYEGYTHEVMDRTKIVTDSSLSSGGLEVVSPPLTRRTRRPWLEVIDKALRGLVRPDRSCGVHLHVGLRGPNKMFNEEGQMTWTQARFTAAKTVVIYGLFQHAINRLVPSSRRGNGYANTLEFAAQKLLNHVTSSQPELDDVFWMDCYDNFSHTRYNAVNITCLRKYGTIEFRQHGGSTNAVKLDAWAQLMGHIVSRAMTVSDDDFTRTAKQWAEDGRSWTVEDLGWFLGLSPKTQLIRYFMDRAERIAGAGGQEPSLDGGPGHSWTDVYDSDDLPYGAAWIDHGARWEMDELDLGQAESLTGNNFRCYDCEDTDIHDILVRHNPNTGRTNGRCYCSDCDTYTELESYHASALVLSVATAFVALGPLMAGLVLLVGCGIGAVHGSGLKRFKNRNALKRLFVNLAERGKQAAGFGWVRRSKPRVFNYLKAPASSHELQGQIRHQLHGQDDTQFMLMHTRYATHGVNNEANAHPHFSSDNHVMLVHNGVVGNHDDVWTALGREPTGPVDSQAVAEALAVGGIEKVVELCFGTMSLIWSDMRDPQGTLKFWTNGGNPLAFGRLDRRTTGPVMVASTDSILTRSAGKRLKSQFECVIGREYTVHPDGKITHRDIPGSEDTCGWGRQYDWRSYGSGRSKVTKVTGEADNCLLPAPADKGYATAEDLDTRYEHYNIGGGWDPFTGANGVILDGYDAHYHMGIDDDGNMYELPAFLQPWAIDEDGYAVMNGDWAQSSTPVSLYDFYGVDHRYGLW